MSSGIFDDVAFMKKQSFSGSAGEHLVLGELLRRNHEAYLAHGETQKGWDIVLLSKSEKPVRIQVKAIDWPNKTAVNGKFESGFDVLVVVLLNLSGKPRYLIMPQPELESIISPFNSKRKNTQRTLTVNKSFEYDNEKNLVQYEDKWALFNEDLHNKSINRTLNFPR